MFVSNDVSIYNLGYSIFLPTLLLTIFFPRRSSKYLVSVDIFGDPGKESNASWSIVRGAHKKPTYAQMVKVSNRVVSDVRKKVSNRVVSEVRILPSTGNHSHTRKRRT